MYDWDAGVVGFWKVGMDNPTMHTLSVYEARTWFIYVFMIAFVLINCLVMFYTVLFT